jgi:enoyl-CoA hydratase
MTDGAGGVDGDLVLVERSEGIATVTLNRPDARNALSSALIAALRAALADVDADDSVAVVILTGADPAFCAGLDLKELSASSGGRLLAEGDGEGIPTGSPWKPLGKPLIGAINGVAITGGFELALNCDFLIASERAAFADTHTRVGFLATSEALRAGLVTDVVAHENLLPAARQVASAIAANNRPAVARLLASYRAIEAEAQGAGLQVEAHTSRDWRKSGGSEGIAERVPGVFARGRSQVGAGGPDA